MPSFYVGQDITLRLTTVDDTGAPANPSAVVFRIKPPSGATAIGETVEVDTGSIYTCTFDAAQAGRYVVRAEALDNNAAVVGTTELIVYVNPSQVV